MNLALAMVLTCGSLTAAPDGLTVNQRLVVACFSLRIEDVVTCLRDGADVNGTFGELSDVEELKNFFRDRWDGSWPMGADSWTPLIALAASSRFPDPPKELVDAVTDNAVTDWKRLASLREKVVAKEAIECRRAQAMTILNILLSHKSKVNAADYNGATALYMAIEERKVAMTKVLLNYGASPNVRVGAYIDGPSDVTPMHRAWHSRELLQLLLDHGGDASARDSGGETPADYVASESDRDFDLIVTEKGAKLVPRVRP